MFEITPENAAEYLLKAGKVPAGRPVAVRALGWGVSNVVLRVDVADEPSFVLKQAREKLRVKAHWVSRLDRIWTEREALTLLDGILPEGTVPRVLFSDEENYLFAMTCAPDDSVVWKEQLLAGKVDLKVARKAGEVLGLIHQATRDHPALKGRLADLSAFEELRIDPFYREIARVHPDIAPEIDALIASMKAIEHPSLVLGDFSPKNILVHSKGLTLVDFETAHAGDPAFDIGFFMSHMHLKEQRYLALHQDADAESDDYGFRETPFHDAMSAFGEAYGFWGGVDGIRWNLHSMACGLARVDGKSPVDYLDDKTRQALRESFPPLIKEITPRIRHARC